MSFAAVALLATAAASVLPTPEALLATRPATTFATLQEIFRGYGGGLEPYCWGSADEVRVAAGLPEEEPYTSVEWIGGEHGLALFIFLVDPEGADPAAQARAVGLTYGATDHLLWRRDTRECGDRPHAQWLASTDRPEILLVVDAGRVTGIAVWPDAKKAHKAGGRTALDGGSWVEDFGSLTASIDAVAASRGPALAALLARQYGLEAATGGPERLAAWTAAVPTVAPRPPTGPRGPSDASFAPVDAALTAAGAALDGPDPVAWTRGWADLRAAAASADPVAVRARMDAIRALERRLVARLRERGAQDDAVGLVCASAALALTPSPADEAALRARANRFLAATTPYVVGDADLEDVALEAWDDHLRRVRGPGSPGLGWPSQAELLGLAAEGGPTRLERSPPRYDARSTSRTTTSRQVVDESYTYDNRARVAEWQAELDAYDAKIAAWHREHPQGAFHNDITWLEQLETFRADHLARRPPDTGRANQFGEITWTSTCRTWTGSARATLSLTGTDRRVEVVGEGGPIEGCQHGEVPALGLPAEDRRPTEAWFRDQELPAALWLASREPAKALLDAWWRDRQLAGADDPLERAVRLAWFRGQGQLPIAVPAGPIPLPAAPPPPPDARPPYDPDAAALLLAVDAECRGHGYACRELGEACAKELLHRVEGFADLCADAIANPGGRSNETTQRAVTWGACVVTATGPSTREGCDEH